MAAKSLRDREAFRLRFSLASQFRRCLYADPELPSELLPAAWWGAQARRLFLDFHTLVGLPALRYFDAVCALPPVGSAPAATRESARSSPGLAVESRPGWVGQPRPSRVVLALLSSFE